MNKNLFVTIIILSAIVIIATINVNLTRIVSSSRSLITLERLEAIGDESGEGSTFVFNGTTWTSKRQLYNILGSNYLPVLIKCTGSETTSKVTLGFSVTYKGVGVSASASFGGTKTDSWEGKKVQCQKGNGNCRNGTSCIGNPI